MVLLVGAAVEDRDIGAAVDQLLQVGRGNPRGAGFVLDHLGEGLAGHMHAAVEAIAGGLPGGDAAVQYRDVPVAERAHARGGTLGQPLAIVAPHDARCPPRHQIVD